MLRGTSYSIIAVSISSINLSTFPTFSIEIFFEMIFGFLDRGTIFYSIFQFIDRAFISWKHWSFQDRDIVFRVSFAFLHQDVIQLTFDYHDQAIILKIRSTLFD